MVRTGYARIVQALSKAAQPPPTRAQTQDRLETLVQFVAKGVLPHKFPKNSRKKWRGSLDPEGKDVGLSADNPNLFRVHEFVRNAQVPRHLSLQLRIMVMETLIYLRLRKIYEVAIDAKFPGLDKQKFRQYLAFDKTPEGIAVSKTGGKAQASSWRQRDQQPDLVVIMPELRTMPQPGEQRHLYPSLLRDWWSKGYVEAHIIDNKNGTRTPSQTWELTRRLGKSKCDPRYLQAESWALRAERFKIELLLLTLKEEIRNVEHNVAMASGDVKCRA